MTTVNISETYHALAKSLIDSYHPSIKTVVEFAIEQLADRVMEDSA